MNSAERAAFKIFGGEPKQAEEQFRVLRQKLLCFFEWNRCSSPEDLAHETICRALRRIAEGAEIYADNPQSYFFGVARNLLLEEWKRSASDPLPMPENFEVEVPAEDTGGLSPLERKMLLGEGLRRLPPEESYLILRYFSDGPEPLCTQLNMSHNAMRIRVHRIRKKLEQYLIQRR